MHLSKPCGSFVSRVVPWCAFLCAPILLAELPDNDPAAEGPWSDIERTTLTVPLVPDGSVTVDGTVSQEEYGNFPGQFVNPGENAWNLPAPGGMWDNEEDTSFTFWLAHDTEYFYVGIDVKDDVVNQDNIEALWKDDSVEIIVDALNDRYDVNTDQSANDALGGHNYVSHNGFFSDWDHDADMKKAADGLRWSNEVDWTFSEDGGVFAVGSEVEGGWHLDVRFAKVLFEDSDLGNKLEDGYVMGFNIGLDDDDNTGADTGDLELQYWWANRLRLIGWNAEAAEDYTAEQIANGDHEKDFEKGLDAGSRLTRGSTGEIIFASDNPFELTPGPNVTVSSKMRLGQLDSATPTYADVVTVRNTGTENELTISAVNVVGADMGLFTVDEFPMTLAPQTSGEIKFTFSPEGRTGDFAATFEIVSDDVDPDDQTRLVDVTASVVNLRGPKAHYSLDEAADVAEMADITGFGNGGTYVGSPTLGVDALASGTAMEVSGNNYGQAEGSALGTPDGFTISTWVNASTNTGSQTIVGKGEGGSPTFALLLTADALEWFVEDSAKFATPAGAVIAGQSHFVTVTWTADKATIYVDGVEAASQDGPDALDLSNANPIYIGSFAGVLSFSGVIDDVQIYDRVLPVEEIQFLMANPGEVIGGSAPPVDPVNATIAWQTPNANTTTVDLIGGPSITFTPFAYPVDNSNDGTFWTGAGGTTGDADLDAVYNSHGWAADGTSIVLEGLTSGEVYQVQLLGAGDTRDCCNTRNQAASDGNGNVSEDFPRGNSSVIGSFTATGSTQEIMIIGGTDNGTDPGLSGFILTDANGSLISASNVGTDGTDITVTLPEPSGLDGYWSFDEGSGMTAADESGEGRDATFRNGAPTWTTGKSGGGLAFDGDDDLTIVGWKGIDGAAPRTVSYWLKTDWVADVPSGNVAWGASETGLKWHLRLNENGGNGPVGAVRTEIEGSFLVGTKVINDDAWHHVVSVLPGGSQFMQDVLHYVDGELQGVGGTGSTTVEINTAGDAEGGTDVTFGSRLQGAVDHYYIGAMDDVSIWSRALSAEEAVALSKGATPLNVAAGNLETGGEGGGSPTLDSVSRTANGVAIGVPDGETYDIQYSQDLENWETIASGATGSYEDTDADRTGGTEGYYRGVKN